MSNNNSNNPIGPRVTMGKMNNINRKKVNLKDPKSTLFRILSYIGSRKYLLGIVLIFSALTTLITVMGTKFNGLIVDKYIVVHDMKGLYKICIVLIVMYALSSLTTFIQNRLMISISQGTVTEIRKDLFIKMQRLPLKYFDTNSSGDIMSRLTNDVDNISTTLSQSITEFIAGIINIIGMLIAMLLLSPLLTLVGLISTPIMFLVTKFVMKRTQPFFIKRQRILGDLNGYIEEMISGQKATLLFGQEENIEAEFGKKNKELTRSAIISEALSGTMGPIMNFINNLTYLLIAVLGGYFMIKGFNITIGVIFTIILYMRNFNRPINEMLNIVNSIQSALAGAERVFEVMDEDTEKEIENPIELKDIEGEVKLKDVEFSYDENKKILNKITLEANKGETVAIVGPTGSGKTTIINLLNRFYDVDKGKVTIDGIEIKNFSLNSLRKSIAIVLQDTYLFENTVRENIRYGRINSSDKEVEEAAKLANAHHFIKQLPEGYDTVLTDNGSNLSQGQRQLLAIARAMISNCSILILDEATSNIDTRTEIQIQEAMKNLMKDKTTFIIAHRLSTIKNADKIVAVKDGEIIEEGNHNELIEKNGFYAGLYNSQFNSGLAI